MLRPDTSSLLTTTGWMDFDICLVSPCLAYYISGSVLDLNRFRYLHRWSRSCKPVIGLTIYEYLALGSWNHGSSRRWQCPRGCRLQGGFLLRYWQLCTFGCDRVKCLWTNSRINGIALFHKWATSLYSNYMRTAITLTAMTDRGQRTWWNEKTDKSVLSCIHIEYNFFSNHCKSISQQTSSSSHI